MKFTKYLAISSLMLTALTTFSFAQDLSKDIKGKWEVKKFQKDKKPELQGGTLEFLSDGTLLSEGVFFGTKKNTFTINKGSSVIIIRNEDGTTEWLATIKNDVLRLKSTGNTTNPERIYITLKRSSVADASMKDGL